MVKGVRKISNEDSDDENQLYFEVPRKTCEQIAPEILRLKGMKSRTAQQHRLHLLKDIMKKAKIKNINEHLRHIIEFDKSEAIIPHGEVSKNLYVNIFENRDFDLYGRLVPKKMLSKKKQEELKFLSRELGIKFTRKQKEIKDYVPDIFENNTEDLKAPRIRSDVWKIGFVHEDHAPVGLKSNPGKVPMSYGNDIYFSYDGSWKQGKMNGIGVYKFMDNYTYEGEFLDNHPCGRGVSVYPTRDQEFMTPSDPGKDSNCTDSSYSGQWKSSRYHGFGKITTSFNSTHEGFFHMGRAHGQGKMILPCGLVYEGEWLDGKPHGRGIMTSKLTGFSYDGTFEKGSICGSGTLITPPPKAERIVRYWPETTGEVLLPGIIRYYMKEKEIERAQTKKKKDEIFGPLRGIQLRDYVHAVRTQLHETRLREKKERFNQALQAAKEQKEKLYQARLKALAGDDED